MSTKQNREPLDIKGEICGGISAAVVSLPWNIVYGLMAFSALGIAYNSPGMAAGFYSSIISGFIAVILGGKKAIITGPKATTTIIFVSVVITLKNALNPALNANDKAVLILTLAFLVVLLCGIFQILFGIFKFGNLIKYIPYPVIAGFLNGTAVLIIINQVWNFLGMEESENFLSLFTRLNEIKIFNLLIGFLVIAIILLAHKFLKKINGILIGLVAGFFIFHLFKLAGFSTRLGETLGAIEPVIPMPVYFMKFIYLFKENVSPEIYLGLIPAAFGMAVLGSLNTLLSASGIQNMTGENIDTNREFIALGLANLTGSFFGSLPGSGTISPTVANHQNGGRGKLSGVVYCFVIMLIFIILTPVAGMIPKIVIAAVLFMVAVKMFDGWSIRLAAKLFRKEIKQKKKIVTLLLNMLLVMLITIFFNLGVAVLLGIFISFFLFISKLSRSIVRRITFGNVYHSNKQREEKHMQLLGKYGHKIAVLELEGSVFFGSIGNLNNEIDKLIQKDVKYFILDIKRINDIESTGAKWLEQLTARLVKNNREMVFSYVTSNVWDDVKKIGVFENLSPKIFPDTDIALEYCENKLLYIRLRIPIKGNKCLLKDFNVFSGISEHEINVFERYLDFRKFNKGELVVRQGDKGNSMFFILSGQANVTLNIAGTSRKKRLQTFSSGTLFGEFTLLDNKVRSANVIAGEDLECFILSSDNFYRLKEENAGICFTFLINLSNLLVARIRNAHRMISELER